MDQTQGKDFAEDSIRREIERLEATNKKEEQRVRNLETKSIQAVNLYFIFQSVILAATSTTSLKCRHWWIPFSLSLLAFTLNLVSFLTHASKSLKARENLDRYRADLAVMKTRRISRSQLGEVPSGTTLNQTDTNRTRIRVGGGRGGGVVMYGCYALLCSSGDGGKCVKLC
ncbi:hypothetical protein NMG60_11027022 [Bertholletia excelsa]